MRVERWIAFLIVISAAAGASRAQVLDEDRFRAIEEGFDDVSPQAASNRVQHVDNRIPLDFLRVYEIMDAPGLLARRSGAVTAVFPRSVYNDDASAPIPPGTVFYLGELPLDLGQPGVLTAGQAGTAPAVHGWNWIDASAPTRVAARRVDLRVPTGPPVVAPSLAGDLRTPSIWGSEASRRQRLEDIVGGVLERARRAKSPPSDRPGSPAGEPDPPQAAPPSGAERGG